MKRIAVQLFLLSLSICSYSMGLIPLLKKDPLSQSSIQQSKRYYSETLPTLTLSTLGNTYCELPIVDRRKVIKRMSKELLMLHGITLLLPEEIRKHILGYILDEDRDAAELFYKMPILEAFNLYVDIKHHWGNSNKPIASLFKLSSEERKLILKVTHPSWYSPPIITCGEYNIINELNENIKHNYLENKEIITFADNKYNTFSCKRHCAIISLFGVVGTAFSGTILGIAACTGMLDATAYVMASSSLCLFTSGGCMTTMCMEGLYLEKHAQIITL
ncbi:MAG TPA: hypothetical protein VLB80_00770 [Candidatus Babeliales bacterium]|nr:hypothetical protein [Candidatus Babeliales bacterium]